MNSTNTLEFHALDENGCYPSQFQSLTKKSHYKINTTNNINTMTNITSLLLVWNYVSHKSC